MEQETSTSREITLLIAIDGQEFPVALNKTKTARALLQELPICGNGSRWGDEIYFDIGVALPSENPREDVDVGDVAYWEPGRAICLFYGPTPASTTEKPRAASPVTVIGALLGNAADLRCPLRLRGIEVRRGSAADRL